jgi:hypothetical protein
MGGTEIRCYTMLLCKCSVNCDKMINHGGKNAFLCYVMVELRDVVLRHLEFKRCFLSSVILWIHGEGMKG